MKLGILGGGQLGRMLALSGVPLGIETMVLDPKAQCPAGAVAEHLSAAYDDAGAIAKLAAFADVVSYEFENVPVKTTEALAAHVPVRPTAAALAMSSDRLTEKRALNALGVPTAPFVPVDDAASLKAAVAELGLPAILKTRRFGYDGKGQWLLREEGDLEGVGPIDRPMILEGFVDFERELSVIGVRGLDGSFDAYPLPDNRHESGVLVASRAPALVDPATTTRAHEIARLLAEDLGYVGVFAVELFDTPDGLVANEVAPRVHNSGHWTIEGAETSQFENHVRAVLGLPLGSCAARGVCEMRNFLGEMPPAGAVLQVPGAHLHDYVKAAQKGRKLGHVTVTAPDEATLDERLARLP